MWCKKKIPKINKIILDYQSNSVWMPNLTFKSRTDYKLNLQLEFVQNSTQPYRIFFVTNSIYVYIPSQNWQNDANLFGIYIKGCGVFKRGTQNCQINALFVISPLHQFSKFNNFLWVPMLIFRKKYFQLFTPAWKLDNLYCHNLHKY